MPLSVRLPAFFFCILFLPKTINKRVKSNHRHNRSTWVPTCVFLSLSRWRLCAVDCLTFIRWFCFAQIVSSKGFKELFNNRQHHLLGAPLFPFLPLARFHLYIIKLGIKRFKTNNYIMLYCGVRSYNNKIHENDINENNPKLFYFIII